MEAPFQGVIDDLQIKFQEQTNNNTEIKELVENIKAEYGNSDLKGKVILKQMLGDVLTDMEKVDTETSNSNRTGRRRFTAIFRGGGGSGSSMSPPNDATVDKMKEGLERVKRKAEYLKDRKKEEAMGESVKELIGREKEKEEIIDQLVLLSKSEDSPVPVIAISGLAGIGKTKLARHVCLDHKLREQVGLPALVHAHEYETFAADIIAEQIISSVVPVIVTATVPFPTTDIIVILDDWRVDIKDKNVEELQTRVKGRWKKEIEDMYLDLRALLEKVKDLGSDDIERINLKELLEEVKKDGSYAIEALKKKVKKCWDVEIEDKYLKPLSEKLKKDGRVDIESEDLNALLEKVKRLRRDAIEKIDVEALKKLKENLKDAHPRVRAIMITTRNSFMVRKIGDSPVKSYDLAGLNEKESVSLFKKTLGQRGAYALAGLDVKESEYSLAGLDVKKSAFLKIAKIVQRCRGVPGSIIAMAKSFPAGRTQELTPEEQRICSYYEEGFPHECFAYFSLFPSDFLFDAERLIHLWMAEGFLRSKSEKSGSEQEKSGSAPEKKSSKQEKSGSEQENLGWNYLRDMVGRSMFQDVKEDEFGEVRGFKLHPLMHDIARLVADRENITMDPTGHKVHSKIKRVSFDLSSYFSREIPPSLFDKEIPLTSIFFFANTQSRLPMQLALSTPVLENFMRFKELCVLDLRDLEIVKVPGSIGDLQDLVYLDLSQNNMEKLPNSITKLSKLQTLKLARCYSLKELPKGFENLSQLKHLDMEGCLSTAGLTSVHLKKLTSLRTLSAIVPSTNYSNNPNLDGLRLAEGNKLLRRQLQIRDTMSSEEIDRHLTLTWHLDPNLGVGEEEKKKKGSQVALEWFMSQLILVGTGSCQVPGSSTSTDTSGQSHNSQVKDSLLTIEFKCLVKLSLQDCSQCKYLSKKDELPKLKILELVRLDNLECVSQICVKEADFYKTLKELTISDCPNLKRWWQDDIEKNDRPVFDSISKLHVHRCPDLTCMPLYPLLKSSTSSSVGKEMVLEDSSSKLLLDTSSMSADYSIPLEHLYIQNCNDLDDPCSAFQQLSSLQSLTVENCAKTNLCDPGKTWEGLKSLRFLTLREIPTLFSLSFGDSVTILRELTIHKCQSLTSIDSIGKLTSLRRLMISECNELKSLPKEIENLKSLKTLIILDCELLPPRCSQLETGDDWPHIRHITKKQVK